MAKGRTVGSVATLAVALALQPHLGEAIVSDCFEEDMRHGPGPMNDRQIHIDINALCASRGGGEIPLSIYWMQNCARGVEPCHTCDAICPTYRETWTGSRRVPCWNEGEFDEIKATTCQRWVEKHPAVRTVGEAYRLSRFDLAGQWNFKPSYEPKEVRELPNYVHEGSLRDKVGDCEYYGVKKQVALSFKRSNRIIYQVTFDPRTRCNRRVVKRDAVTRAPIGIERIEMTIADSWYEDSVETNFGNSPPLPHPDRPQQLLIQPMQSGCSGMCGYSAVGFALDMKCGAPAMFGNESTIYTCRSYCRSKVWRNPWDCDAYARASEQHVVGISPADEVRSGERDLYTVFW